MDKLLCLMGKNLEKEGSRGPNSSGDQKEESKGRLKKFPRTPGKETLDGREVRGPREGHYVLVQG